MSISFLLSGSKIAFFRPTKATFYTDKDAIWTEDRTFIGAGVWVIRPPKNFKIRRPNLPLIGESLALGTSNFVNSLIMLLF